MTSERGHHFVFPEGLDAPVTLTHQSERAILSVPHKTEKIEIPLGIPKEAFQTKGRREFKPDVLGQPYTAVLERREDVSIGDRRSTQESCSYMKVENVCETRTKTNAFGVVEDVYGCEPEHVQKSGWQTIYFRPATTRAFIDLKFVTSPDASPVATIEGTETREERIVDDTTDCW